MFKAHPDEPSSDHDEPSLTSAQVDLKAGDDGLRLVQLSSPERKDIHSYLHHLWLDADIQAKYVYIYMELAETGATNENI